MSPDVFLSQNRISTSGYGGLVLNSNPAIYVASLQLLSSLRSIDQSGRLVDNMYVTPGFTPGTFGPADFSLIMEQKLNAAMDAYRTSFKSGDLAAVHRAQDQVNLLRMTLGYGALPWFTDFEIVAEGPTAAGELARIIYSERQSIADTGAPSFAGSPIPWFDTVDAYKALAAFQATVYQSPNQVAENPANPLAGVFKP